MLFFASKTPLMERAHYNRSTLIMTLTVQAQVKKKRGGFYVNIFRKSFVTYSFSLIIGVSGLARFTESFDFEASSPPQRKASRRRNHLEPSRATYKPIAKRPKAACEVFTGKILYKIRVYICL